ncbi:MAG TPA: LCP family protein [Anaerolineaceae bacterium]|nr:LCP family protein [Anaerolineaceae bacterium]
MTKKTPRSWIVLSIVIIAVFGVGAILWNSSLFGKKLPNFVSQNFTGVSQGENMGKTQPVEQMDQTQSPLEGNAQEVAADDQTGEFVGQVPAGEKSNIAGSSLEPVCGQSEPMIFLGLGIDEQEQSDVIRLVRIDFLANKILVLSIPRDFWVPIPGMTQYDITQFKINAAYGFGEYYLGRGQGVVLTSNTIYQNFGIKFDRYAVFHFSNFVDLVDAVGGVEIELDKPIGAYGTSGKTHLDGATALEYARAREADSDMFRVRRQSAIISALYSKVLVPENLLKLPKLGVRFLSDKTIKTDLSVRDMYSLICLANKLNRDSIVFQDIPADYYRVSHTNTGRYILLPTKETAGFAQGFILSGKH